MEISQSCLQPSNNQEFLYNMKILKAIIERKQSKDETKNSRAQLEKERLEKAHKVCIDELVEKFNKLSEKFEETSDKIVNVQKENKDLQQANCSKISEEKEIANEIAMLEFYLKRNIECNKNLEKTLKKKQGFCKSMKRTMIAIESSITCKTAEVENSRCQLTDAEIFFDKENEKLYDLLQRNAENVQKIKKSMSTYRELEEKLATLRETGPMRMDLARQNADAARMQLADTSVTLADWNTKCEHAEESCRELRMKNKEEMCFAQIEIKKLDDERDQLVIQLCDVLNRLKTAECDNRHPNTAIKERAEQLYNKITEAKELERKIYQERSQQAQVQAKREIETKLIEDEAIVNRQRLIVIENEMKALRQTYERNEQKIINVMS